MADFNSLSYVQRRILEDFPAIYYPALEFFFKIDILLQNFRAKVYPGKWHIPGYPKKASTPPPGLDKSIFWRVDKSIFWKVDKSIFWRLDKSIFWRLDKSISLRLDKSIFGEWISQSFGKWISQSFGD